MTTQPATIRRSSPSCVAHNQVVMDEEIVDNEPRKETQARAKDNKALIACSTCCFCATRAQWRTDHQWQCPNKCTEGAELDEKQLLAPVRGVVAVIDGRHSALARNLFGGWPARGLYAFYAGVRAPSCPLHSTPLPPPHHRRKTRASQTPTQLTRWPSRRTAPRSPSSTQPA